MQEKGKFVFSYEYMPREICFEDFFDNDTNYDAYLKAISFSDNIKSKISVLNIYGEEYTGKSYLLLSIIKLINNMFFNVKSRYMTADEFLDMDCNMFEAIDVLLIDDIDIADNIRLIERVELLHKQGKNIAFTSIAPVNLGFIETVGIKLPDAELIKDMLGVLLSQQGLFPDDTALDEISATFSNKKQEIDYVKKTCI